MAAADYTPTPVPPGCVDTPTVNQWLQNLNGLMEAALQDTGGVTCVPVRQVLTDGECLTLDSSNALTLSSQQQSTGVVEKKIFLIAARVTVTDAVLISDSLPDLQPGQQLVNYAVTAKCGGIPIAGSGVLTSSANSVSYINVNMVGQCTAGVPVEICFDILSDTVPHYASKPEVTISLCGAVLCISEPRKGFLSDIPGFFCAPDVPDGCLIGREGIHLMQQNTRALCSFASQGYLEASCDFSATFNDPDSHVLAQPQYDVQYLIVGSARICASNSNQLNTPITLTAQITGGCSNGSTTACFPVTEVFNGAGPDGGTGQTTCFTVPFIACGNCLAGGSIFAGLNTSSVCEDSDTPFSAPNLVIESISQTYTLFTFRRVDPIAEGLLPIFEEQPIDKCIARKSVEYLVDKADALFDYFCDRNGQQIGCTNISEGFGPIGEGVIYSGVIRPPSPPPPPPEPVPTSKVNVFCMFRVCFRNLFPTTDQAIQIDVTISCGGAAPYTLTIYCIVPASIQPPRSDGDAVVIGSDTVCKNIPVIHTYSGCPVTDPVLMDITVTGGQVEATGSFNCLSFNI